ncbi:MAG TPA: hypothetical protein VFA12_18040 [Stellaceae bacterium]|nr:hypothetical protein [Stellaceae bacterium]
MARTTALNQLQDQIEAIRREAYAQGYADAMQAVREYASRPAGGSPTAPAGRDGRRRGGRPRKAAAEAPAAQPSPPARTGRGRPARAARSSGRPQRGTNARLVQEVLQAIAPRAARPTEIRDALKRDKGVSMAFTSIRHALGQLEARHAVEQVADSKTWRATEGG